MIYNEGFEMRINKHRFFNFNNYFRENGEYKSNCAKTLIGWYHEEGTNNYACFEGR